MTELQEILERIVREEVRRTLDRPPPRRFVEFLSDPTSGQLSMSRLCLGLLVLGCLSLVVLTASNLLDVKELSPLGTLYAATVASVAAIYGANSVAGAWQGGKLAEKAKTVLLGKEEPKDVGKD